MSSQQTNDPNLYARAGVFQQSYSPLTYAGLLVATLYCGIFVMMNNHYVFRPKLQRYVRRLVMQPKSSTRDSLRELIVDSVLSLSALTFSLSSVMMSGSTNNIESFVAADSIWMGIYVSIVLYRQRNTPSKMNVKYALKNILAMVLGYLCLLLHVQFNFYFITLGIILVLMTAANILTNIYFEKVEKYIDKTFFQ